MVLAKSKNAVGLGNSLMNDRFGKGKGHDMRRGNAIARTSATGDRYVTNEHAEASWVKMRSITEQGALDEFLSTAELAGTDFTAEKMTSVKILSADQRSRNPFLLSRDEERGVLKKHAENRKRLTVPRRPKWDKTTTRRELDERERGSLLDWRRGLAELQESNDLLLTPFERNIEVWRQLWRVIERSDLVVQIVDARNPLLYRSEDLAAYVKEVDGKKENLLLVNKADMMSKEQRVAWAEYFVSAGINFKFFSAALARAENEAREEEESDESESEESEEEEDDDDEESDVETPAKKSSSSNDPTRILSTADLESLFLANAPSSADPSETKKPIEIGLVGYPNVGKSSTINALLGSKKVSVSSTPGKTKHFQTILFTPQITLCDCPGLVFPNFATTRAELVCAGVLPIDQMREYLGPAGLVAERIPRTLMEKKYGLKIKVRAVEEGGNVEGVPTANELLSGVAEARGFRAGKGMGRWDEGKSARLLLKDFVSGKLPYCHPPPPLEGEEQIDGLVFNQSLYEQFNPVAIDEDASPSDDLDELSLEPGEDVTPLRGEKTARIDKNFFARQPTGAGIVSRPFHHQYSEQGQQKILSGRKEREMVALERGIDVSELKSSKKHFKGAIKVKRRKARDGLGGAYDQ
jgi:large subunit GTPase 1